MLADRNKIKPAYFFCLHFLLPKVYAFPVVKIFYHVNLIEIKILYACTVMYIKTAAGITPGVTYLCTTEKNNQVLIGQFLQELFLLYKCCFMAVINHTLRAGAVLISAPELDDPNFEKVVIYVAEHNEKGALGFVMNQVFHRQFNELTEFQHIKPFPLHEGGPMEKEKIYFIHRIPASISAGAAIGDGLYLGGNFKQAVQYINSAQDAENQIRLFLGYSGWDPNQLEAEIEEGSWLVVPASVTTLFQAAEQQLWEALYNRKAV
jgi:putative transcriptional regulator